MPIEPFESFSEKMTVGGEEEEEEEAVDMEVVETVEVNRHHIMVEEEEESAVDVDTMTNQAAGPGIVGKVTTSRGVVVGVEVAMMVGIRTVATTNKSEATMEAGNGLHRGNRVHRTMGIEQRTITAKFNITSSSTAQGLCRAFYSPLPPSTQVFEPFEPFQAAGAIPASRVSR